MAFSPLLAAPFPIVLFLGTQDGMTPLDLALKNPKNHDEDLMAQIVAALETASPAPY